MNKLRSFWARAMVALALLMAAPTFALTNTVTSVREIMDGAENNFDYGLTIALGIVGVVVAIGWLKYGVRGAVGAKKT